jgi:hypothetical protein
VSLHASAILLSAKTYKDLTDEVENMGFSLVSWYQTRRGGHDWDIMFDDLICFWSQIAPKMVRHWSEKIFLPRAVIIPEFAIRTDVNVERTLMFDESGLASTLDDSVFVSDELAVGTTKRVGKVDGSDL